MWSAAAIIGDSGQHGLQYAQSPALPEALERRSLVLPPDGRAMAERVNRSRHAAPARVGIDGRDLGRITN